MNLIACHLVAKIYLLKIARIDKLQEKQNIIKIYVMYIKKKKKI